MRNNGTGRSIELNEIESNMNIDTPQNLVTDNIELNTFHEQTFQFMVSVAEQQSFIHDILLAHKVTDSGVPNRFGCRIQVQSTWNLDLLDSLLIDYHDRDVVEWLKYGFSVSRDDGAPLKPADKNHAGALAYPQHIQSYLETEIKLGATMGPFRIPPFIHRIGVSPLSSREKRNTLKRRIILDLSYPEFYSVNDGIDKNFYCGQPINLKYPTVDDMIKRIVEIPGKVLLWKRDLARAFRLVPLCPRDYSLISMRWNNLFYIDKFMPMGLVSAAYSCQKITNAITYIHRNMGYWSINYLDDFGSAEPQETAWDSYNAMGRLLKSVGATEAVEKAVPPTPRLEFLGNILDTDKYTVEVSEQRLHELMIELNNWLQITRFTKKRIQSLIGKLNFITNCVKAGRVFLNRLISEMKKCPEYGFRVVTKELLKDVQWWLKYLPTYNGVSMMWLLDNMPVDTLLATDACLIGGGAVCGNEYFHVKFPPQVLQNTSNIAQLELLVIVLALKVWAPSFTGMVVRISSDSLNSVRAVNNGKSNDEFMLQCIREIAWISAKNGFLFTVSTHFWFIKFFTRFTQQMVFWRQMHGTSLNHILRTS